MKLAVVGTVLVLTSLMPLFAAGRVTVEVVPRPDLAAGNRHYLGNRPPLEPSPLRPLPIGSVRPAGWTRRVLELQNAGFHGHLPELSRFLKTEDNAWLSPAGRGANGWEEEPYWLKGFQDCAFLVGDTAKLAQARVWIEGALKSQQGDGWFGPGEGRSGVATDLQGRDDLWPNMIMLFCLQSYYEQTGDGRVLDLMERYFRYLESVPEDRFLVGYWPKMRGGDLLWSVVWLYNRTGGGWLLELARKVHRHSARWDEDLINLHNVNVAQGFREPAEFFVVSRDRRHLEATQRVWSKVRDLYGQVPGGMFGGDENCRPGFDGPRQAIETCGIAEEMLSDEILLAITGDPVWADRCENAAFNSLPAAFTADMKALRYLTAPNQPQSDHVSKAPGIQNGGPMYCLDPYDHRCCQHNAGHAWPFFVKHAWYAAPGDGLAAVFPIPSSVTAHVGDGTVMATITETTRYPFEGLVQFEIATTGPVVFPLYLRVPGWCEEAHVRVNGRELGVPKPARGFLRLEGTWRTGDQIELEYVMPVRWKEWGGARRALSVERGPLTFSLKIQERYQRHGGTDRWPAWDLLPESSWNYGLDRGMGISAEDLTVVHRPWPADDQPWEANAVPIRIRAHARKIPAWTLDERGLVRELQAGPVHSDEPLETVELIPMGAARLRISAFPEVSQRPDAKEWKPPVSTGIRASHCYEGDSVEAVADGVLPAGSGDGAIPRFTWWDHRGTSEWIERRFDAPKEVSQTEVYWFDDTGRGGCRLPVSWKVLVRQGQDWVPVSGASGFPVVRDAFNLATFEAVTTDALRLEVQLAPGFSGGILEWRTE